MSDSRFWKPLSDGSYWAAIRTSRSHQQRTQILRLRRRIDPLKGPFKDQYGFSRIHQWPIEDRRAAGISLDRESMSLYDIGTTE